MSDIQYVYPLIHNKVTSPHYVTPTLRRARLIDWLNENAECRAVVIAADAGYGKTTLLWQWEREVDFPCYWYKLDRNDRDWSLHISYLIEAISQRHPGFGRRAHSMLQQLGGPGSSRPGVAAYLLAEMYERLTEPCTFIIDDWQFVASVTEVRGLWNQILRDAPPTCRFVFLSRAKPHLQFARFKTHGGYAEMRTDALRFTDREIDDLFRDIYNDPLDPAELVELERRTEGWAASLQLVEVSLRERRTPEERRAFIHSITATRDSDLFSFLAEEVLDQQDERVRDFLEMTSILQQIVPELAERLAGVSDGARLLADLEQRGLFTYRLDTQEERYRYHGLFRDFLQRRLALDRTEGEITGLHIHAASFYETHHEWPDAIHHYLRAGLQPQAARLIARFGEEVATEGRLGSVDEWLEELPTKTIRDNARLSLLHGEARGIRGDWGAALASLTRSRAFFARKGDRRMEALACLKLSTVHANHGDITLAVEAAREGLQIAPEDALATRLRLSGNLAITTTWMESHLDEVARICRRIAVEAKARGWEHFAAIALHNLGTVQRHMGQIEESIRSLELAARYWAALPANPFADNAELVAALLAGGQATRAQQVAETAVTRTEPWPRPHAEAVYGRLLVLAYQGRFREVQEAATRLLEEPTTLGPTAELLNALLIEATYLMSPSSSTAYEPNSRHPLTSDPRLAPIMAPARAISRHVAARCSGECLSELEVLRQWDARGARYVVTLGLVKIGALLLEHGGKASLLEAMEAVRRAKAAGGIRALRWWLRQYAPYAQRFIKQPAGVDLLCSLAESDPEGWRSALTGVLPQLQGVGRERALEVIAKVATKETVDDLRKIEGSDIALVRRRLIQQQAPKLFVRSFGAMTIHKGSWTGGAITVDRRRTRMLLGLLVAFDGVTLTRDTALDTMWPDSDPSAAVNSLNQTVFQLRRAIDPDYKDGDSPQYVISTVDMVQLNPDLVRTDLREFRRLAQELSAGTGEASDAGQRMVELIRGEFLQELKYDDWASRIQTAVHAEVRASLMPVATGQYSGSRELGIRAACALVDLDEFDEGAYVAMAEQLASSGKRNAARDVLVRFGRKLESELLEPMPHELADAMTRLGLQVQ